MTKPPLIKCHRCHGNGVHPMGSEYFDTLKAVYELGSACTERVAKQLKWSGNISSINNRLADLHTMGFLRRRKEGRVWIYYR